MTRAHTPFSLPRLLVLLLLLISGNIHPNPGRRVADAKILQFNCNGLRSSLHELRTFLSNNNVVVACIQESKLQPSSPDPKFANFTILRADRERDKGGGLVTLIHHSLTFTPVDLSHLYASDPFVELLAHSVISENKPTTIVNLYVPPASSCPPRHRFNLDPLLQALDGEDAIILGDFNAHDDSWFSTLNDARGDSISSSIDSSSFISLNVDTPTRLPPSGNPSSPDISLVSAHLAPSFTWSTSITLNSDHLPILLSILDSIPPPRPSRPYQNFKLADWRGFREESERLFARERPPRSCDSGEKAFRRILLTASKRHIPAGFRRDFVPGVPCDAVPLLSQRDALRRQNPTDPEIEALNRRIQEITVSAAWDAWSQEVEKASSNPSSTPFWHLLRRLSGKRTHQPPNQPIAFSSPRGPIVYTKKKVIAKKFNKQYSCPVPHRQNPQTRRLLRKIRKRPIDHSYTPFSLKDVANAVRGVKNSSAVGPDGLTNLHLRQLGPNGIAFLHTLFNLSLAHSNLPAIWKHALIIPVPKPNKPLNLSTSYRPISLLCPAAKVLEGLVRPLLLPHLPRAPFQHGFSPGHSTVTALLPLATKVTQGFNQRKPPQRTVVAAADISKAFDTIDHVILLEKLLTLDLHPNVMHFLATFVRGRTSSVSYQGVVSPPRIVRQGVAQGARMSPDLFNFYVEDQSAAADLHEGYADDTHDGESDVNAGAAATRLSGAMSEFSDWAKSKLSLLRRPSQQSRYLLPTLTRVVSIHKFPSTVTFSAWTRLLKSWVSLLTPISPSHSTPRRSRPKLGQNKQ